MKKRSNFKIFNVIKFISITKFNHVVLIITFNDKFCTHTQTITINNDLCPPIPTHSMTWARPCPPMLFKLRPCIKKLWNVYYPRTPSLGWIGQIGGLTLLVPHKRVIWQPSLSQPTMEAYVTLPIISHRCPPKDPGHGWAWAWVWAPNVGL